MPPYLAQSLFRRLGAPALRMAAIHAARGLGIRHLVTRIDTNDVCNLKCVMCPLSDPDRVPAAKPMPVEQFRRVAEDLLPRTRWLYLSCATEPLATPHFDAILDEVARHRVPFVSYCTNGLLLKDRFIEATLRSGVDEVIVSVDGATAATYEAIRVGGRFAQLEERLAALTAARAARMTRKPELRCNFTVQDDNCHEVAAFVGWARRYDVRVIQYRVFRPLAGAVKQHDGAATMAVYARELAAARRECKAHGIRLLADPPVARAEPRAAARAGPDAALPAEQPQPTVTVGEPRPRVNCQLPWLTVYVRADGTVFPCGGGHPPVGNIFASGWREIERAPPMVELRRSLRSCAKDVCVDCQRFGASGV
jgi:MoaA/NifB/PqqE/SkfB family radical SAM enzyme